MPQASLEKLRALNLSPTITDLQSTPRALTGIEMAKNVSDMFLTKPVQEWADHYPNIDMPGSQFN